MTDALTPNDIETLRGALDEVAADDRMIQVRADVLRALLPEPTEGDDVMQAEEPIEDRLQRAFCNGFIEGVRRGSWGRWDHS